MAGESDKDLEKRFFERQLVVFSLGNEEFGVDISDVKEIIKLETITKLPNTDSYIDGIINLRGGIVVIIDLAKKIGLVPSQRGKNTRILVMEIAGSMVGFVVDSCNEVLRITGDKIEEAPRIITDKINADYLQGVGILDERLIIIIDLGSVLEEKDLNAISSAKNAKASESSGSKRKLLIVEDSSMMRGTLKSYVDPKRFNIFEAEDGEQAVKIFGQELPEIVLLDIKLPNKNGVEVLKEIKEKSPETIVIMETSVYEDQTKDECMKLGARAYLKKPISKKDIQDLLLQV